MKIITIIRWILFLPVFALVNTFGQYYYMELVNYLLPRRMIIAGKDIWLVSSFLHIFIFMAAGLLLPINNLALAVIPKPKIGVLICFFLYLGGLILRYVFMGIHFTWFEFYYLLGVGATLHAFTYMYDIERKKREMDFH